MTATRRVAPIVVASMGRSGSTVLSDAICDANWRRAFAAVRHTRYRRSMLRQAWRLNAVKLQAGYIYKTHDLPPGNGGKSGARFVYTFADPFDVISSLLALGRRNGMNWINRHATHMIGGRLVDLEELLDNDVLCLESHFESWLAFQAPNVAGVRYDRLWEQEQVIAEFLGIPLRLPPRLRRGSSPGTLSPGQFRRLEQTYGALREKIGRIPIFGALQTDRP